MKKPRYFLCGWIPMISIPSLEIKRHRFNQEIHQDVFDRLGVIDVLEVWLTDWEGIKVMHMLSPSTRKVKFDQSSDICVTISLTKEEERNWIIDLKDEIEEIKAEREVIAADNAKD